MDSEQQLIDLAEHADSVARRRQALCVAVQAYVNGLLRTLHAGPPVMCCQARSVVSLEPRILVRLELLRWKDYLVSNRHHVTRVVETRLQERYPEMSITIEGWWYSGDPNVGPRFGQGQIPDDQFLQDSDVAGAMVVTEFHSDVDGQRFLPTLPSDDAQGRSEPGDCAVAVSDVLDVSKTLRATAGDGGVQP